MTDRLVWIDCEMTGLDLARDALIEIACLITDGNLTVLDEGVDLVIKPPAETVDGMLPVVRDMHTTSGLISELASGVTLAEAQEQVLRYVRSHIPDARKVPLCGNSIATDRAFLARDMPELDAFLHYRMVDVSSIKELARRGRTSPARPSTAVTGPWPTSGRASRSCATTARRCSSRSRARTRPRRARSPATTAWPRPAGPHRTGTPRAARPPVRPAASPGIRFRLLRPRRYASCSRRRWWV
jgi:oligoribonuclease